MLDGALVRQGRLGKQIELPYPNENEIENLIKVCLRKIMEENLNWKKSLTSEKESEELLHY